MTGRNFRDRYETLSRSAKDVPAPPHAADGWPLPRGARRVESADGICCVHDAVYAGDAISAAHDAFLACMRQHSERYSDPADLVFLDTETTGLAGGTGTHVFLVGVGRFAGGAFHVRQFFMRHPGDERSLLSALEADLRHATTLVTYNGRSFDMPLLETRYRMHGRALTPPEQHVDLLSAARAIWKHRLPNCALGTIERMVLGVSRELDAPGWMIPQLYFSYLRSRRIELLEPVFEHNRTDIVSLARIAALVHGYEARINEPANAIDRLAVTLHCLRRYATEETIDDLKRYWGAAAVPSDLRLRALRELTTVLKRKRRYAEALIEWERALHDPSRAVRLYAYEEAAKYHEHFARDPKVARELARKGADGAVLARDAEAVERFERRLKRLDGKLQHIHRSVGDPKEGM
jgi:uncharacterized protein